MQARKGKGLLKGLKTGSGHPFPVKRLVLLIDRFQHFEPLGGVRFDVKCHSEASQRRFAMYPLPHCSIRLNTRPTSAVCPLPASPWLRQCLVVEPRSSRNGRSPTPEG